MKNRLAALALCLALLQVSCLARAASPQAPCRAGPSPRHQAPFSLRLPLPTYGFMHARVNAGPLPVYGNRLLEGEPLGQLAAGDFTTVEVYTQGVGKVTGASAGLFGGFVRLAPLEELPDEHYASYEALFRALILADPLTGGAVTLWQNYDLSGGIQGYAQPGETVTAREDESGYSMEITLENGLTGYVAPEHLLFIEPIEN